MTPAPTSDQLAQRRLRFVQLSEALPAGFAIPHSSAWTRPRFQGRHGVDPFVRFIAKLAIAGCSFEDTSCIEWRGTVSDRGYGTFTIGFRRFYAHRWLWEQLFGPLPTHDDQGRRVQLDHQCEHTQCVNPAHIEAVSDVANVLRGTGFSAINARKTHCPRGHAYTEENTYRLQSGYRACGICRRELKRLAYARDKEIRNNASSSNCLDARDERARDMWEGE